MLSLKERILQDIEGTDLASSVRRVLAEKGSVRCSRAHSLHQSLWLYTCHYLVFESGETTAGGLSGIFPCGDLRGRPADSLYEYKKGHPCPIHRAKLISCSIRTTTLLAAKRLKTHTHTHTHTRTHTPTHAHTHTHTHTHSRTHTHTHTRTHTHEYRAVIK